MALEKQKLEFVPLGVDQRTDYQQLPIGKCLELINYRQKTPKVFSKRNGYAKKYSALGNGRGLSTTGDALIARTNEGIYAESASLQQMLRKADCAPVAVPPAVEAMPYGYKPSVCLSPNAGLRYYFAGDIGQNSSAEATLLQVGNGTSIAGTNRASWWYFRVVDATTGAEVVATTKIATVVGQQAKAVAVGGFVWLFVGAGGGQLIYAAKFDPANPSTAPVITTYYNGGGTSTIEGWDVFVTQAGTAAVVAMGGNLLKAGGGTINGAVVSYLDTTTGLPQAALGSVGIATAVPAAECCVQWLPDENAAPTSLFFTGMGGVAENVYQVSASALTLTATIALAGRGTTTTMVAGYVKSGGGFAIFYSSPGATPESDALTRADYNAAGTGTGGWAQLAFARTMCTQPFRLSGGTAWYLIAIHDDNLAHLQPAYYLLDAATGKILGRAQLGESGDAGQRATYVAGTTNLGWIAPVSTDTTTVTAALNIWTGSQYVTRAVQFVIDDSAPGAYRRLGPMVRASDGQELSIPGAWPHHAAGANVSEYIPMYPRNAPSVAAGPSSTPLPAGGYSAYYLYARRDALGNLQRSQPSPAGTVVVKLLPDTDALVFSAATPTNAQIAAGGDYGLVQVATAAALPTCTAAGSGSAKTLTATANAALTVDGSAVANGWVVLVKNQVNPVDNGLYTVTQAGSAGTPFILTRAANYSDWTTIVGGRVIYITFGATNAGTYWAPASVRAITWTVDNLRITNSAIGDWQIEFYLTLPSTPTVPNLGAPFLQFSVPNDPTAPQTSLTTVQSSIFTNETLYSYAGAELPNEPPPPFGIAASWRNRLLLSDTDESGVVWVSKEKAPGVAYHFSATLTFNISDGSGRIRAMGPVDYNAFALFKQDGIWVITGAGPDAALGRDMYEPVRLPGTMGCTNAHSLVTTPVGLVFQASSVAGSTSDVSDGGIYLLTRDLRIVYLGAGVEGYRGQQVSAASYVPEEQQVRLHLDTAVPSLGSIGQITVGASQAYRMAQDPNTLALWRLQETGRDCRYFHDATGGGHDLSVDGGYSHVPASRRGRNNIGRARYFLGEQDRGAAMGPATGAFATAMTANMTVEAWVNVQSFGGTPYSIFAVLSGSGEAPFGLMADLQIGADARLRWQHQDAVPTVRTFAQGVGSTISTNTWTHIAAVKTVSGANAMIAFYVNGILQATVGPLANCGSPSGKDGISMGGDSGFTGVHGYAGYLKDVRVSSVARQASEIAADAAAVDQHHSIDASTLGLWRCEETPDAADASANGMDLTLDNSAGWSFVGTRPTFLVADAGCGGSRAFDGVTSYSGPLWNEPLHPASQTFMTAFTSAWTMEAWVRLDPAAAYTANYTSGGCIWQWGSTQTGAFGPPSTLNNTGIAIMVFGDGSITAAWGSSSGADSKYTTPAGVITNLTTQPHHIAVTAAITGANMVLKFYVDGVLVNTSPNQAAYVGNVATNNGTCRLGYAASDISVAANGWMGEIYEVRLSNKVRSATEIAAVYAQGQPCATSGTGGSGGTGATQGNFVLVFDMRNPAGGDAPTEADQVGQWYVWTLTATGRSSVVHKGLAHWLDVNGQIRYEASAQWFDDTSSPVLTRVHFAPIGRLEGWEHIYRMLVSANARGGCTALFSAYNSTNDLDVPTLWQRTIPLNSGDGEFEVHPTPGRVTQAEYVLDEVASGQLTEGIAFRGIGLEVGIGAGLRRLHASQRVT